MRGAFLSSSSSTRRLWAIAGGLFVSGWALKSLLFSAVQAQVVAESRERHEEASRHLAESRKSAEAFTLPPLDDKRREELRQQREC